MSDEADLLVERTGDGIVLVTLNRPKARNTVSFAMWEAFARLLGELEEGTPPRALILRGAQGHFSNGGDMKVPPARGEGALAGAKRLEMAQKAIQRLIALPIPSIAAVEGGAWGVSWGLVLACDVLIAGEGAEFGAPFLRMGLAPDGGVAWQLTRQLGRRRAAEIVLSGRTLGAREAFDLGLVSRLVADGNAEAEALAFARAIGDGNREASELAKRLIHSAEESTLAASLALELAYAERLLGGAEHRAAREAFAARSAARRQG